MTMRGFLSEDEITLMYGKRCAEIDPLCVVCQMWTERDYLNMIRRKHEKERKEYEEFMVEWAKAMSGEEV